LAILTRLFGLWHRFCRDLRDPGGNPKPIDRSELTRKSLPLQKKLFALADAHVNHANRDVSNFARALFLHFERLFLFLERDDVEPTNNVVERILRIPVQWRKTTLAIAAMTEKLPRHAC